MTGNLAILVLIICSVLLAVIILAGSMLYFAFNPKRAIKRTLKSQAKSDYERSRGTIHRTQLRKALAPVLKERRRLQQSINKVAGDYTRLKAQQDAELEKSVIAQLVANDLTTIRGIGPQIAGRIRHYIFRGNLDDLQYAYRVQGVGLEKQHEINMWIRKQKARLPSLIQSDFPGKSVILSRYGSELARKQEQHSQLVTQLAQIDEIIQKPRDVLVRFEKVSVVDYYQALLAGEGSKTLNDYEKGAFAEWESVPGWFKELMEWEGNHVQ